MSEVSRKIDSTGGACLASSPPRSMCKLAFLNCQTGLSWWPFTDSFCVAKAEPLVPYLRVTVPTVLGTDAPVKLPFDGQRPPYLMTKAYRSSHYFYHIPPRAPKALLWELFLLPLNCFLESDNPVPIVLILKQMTWTPLEFRRAKAYEAIDKWDDYLKKRSYKSIERRAIYVRQSHTMLGRA